jgi:AGCS family alanine or glycine:cation symporter
LFAFTTVIAWAYYGEKCVEYLFGERFVIPYRVVYTLLILPGALFSLETIWAFADAMNGLMVIPNMIALLGLSGVIQKETKLFVKEQNELARSSAQSVVSTTIAANES